MRGTILVFLLGCASNPAGGLPQLNLISEKDEIEIGRVAAKELEAKLTLLDDPKLAAYVASVGQQVAARSGRPNLPWRFSVIDDPMVNAFALPGGFVYVTRGILSHLGSEAELAVVLAHEVAHVSARHNVHRMSQKLLLKKSFGWTARLFPQSVVQVTSAGVELVFMKYSRSDERQADDIGLGYAATAGFDAQRGAKVFYTLDRVAPAQTLEWLQSHPDPERRYESALGRTTATGAIREREYVTALKGLVFGEDPRRGAFVGNRYVNPTRGFAITFPEGWEKAKKGDTVAAVSKGADAIAQVSFAEAATVEAAVQEFLKDHRLTSDSTRVLGGLQARWLTFESDGLRGTVVFAPVDGKVLECVVSAKGEGKTPDSILESLTRVEKNVSMKVARIVPVQIERETPVREFLSRSSVDVKVANALQDDQIIAAGRWLKEVH